jgi:tetratricopeptide (TPR) repeat protein
LATTADWLAEATPGSVAEAWAIRATGHAERELGAYELAIARYEQAEEQFAQLGLEVEVARTGLGHVWALRLLGRYEEALGLGLSTRRKLATSGQFAEAAVQTLNLGTVYKALGRLSTAHQAYQSAAHAFHRHNDRTNEATAQTNLGNVLADLGRYDEAERAQRRATRLYTELGQTAQIARARLNLGLLLKRRGDYGRALVALDESRGMYEQLGVASGVALTDLDLAQTYLALNLQREAVAASQRARAGLARLNLPLELSQALVWSAAAAERAGESAGAADLLAEAEQGFHAIGNRLWENVAIVLHANLTDGDAATLTRLLAAERALTHLGSRDRAIEARLTRGNLFQRLGATEQALACYRSAARALRRLEDDQLSYRVSLALGRLFEARAPSWALRRYGTAIEHLERLRRRARADDLKLSFVADKLDVYERSVALLLDRKHQQRAIGEAFAMAERGKSIGLLEDLLAQAERGGRAAASLARRLRDQRAALQEAYARQDNAGSAGSVDEAMTRKLEFAVADLVRELQLLVRGEITTGPVELDQVRRHLAKGIVLLEYYSVGQELICFVVDGERLRVRRGLGTIAGAQQLFERIRFQLGKGVYGADYLLSNLTRLRRGLDRVLADLWRELLEPLRVDLRNASEVVLVPHGPLHGLPLHAALDGDTYLCDRAAVSYAPSARVFDQCTSRQSAPPVRPLFVAPRDESLPWVAREVQLLAGIFPDSQKLAGRQASLRGIRRRAGHFDLLHLAAHGTFRADNPSFSALRLTDGWLSVADLAELSRDTSLVTLSACETGRSGLAAGDDLVGLTRAVLGAGAASLLASLWSVHDESTSHFMAEFYRRLQAGEDKTASLQGAMRAARRIYDHPYFWAPFTLAGAR